MQGQSSRHFISDQRGATAITVALMFTALFALLGAAVDTSRLMMARGKLQTALDAAAIAAVRDASTLNVQSEVTKFFNANFPTGYLGMTPGTITFTQSGNTYTFTVSSNLPQAIMPSIGMGSSSNTITVTSKVTLGSSGSGGPATELSLILDNSGAMNQLIGTSSTRRIDVLRSTVNSLMDRIAGRGTYVSMVNFNDAVRVDPTQSNSWLQTPFTSTLPDFSSQSNSNHFRFDGCMSTKYSEVNYYYPSSNYNAYLTNNDHAPSSGKFRQYLGPVDFQYYSQPATYYNYNSEITQETRTERPRNTLVSTSTTRSIYSYNYVTGAYSSTTLMPPFFYGSIQLRDLPRYEYYAFDGVSRRYREENTTTSGYYAYDFSTGFGAYASEYSAYTPAGPANNSHYFHLRPASSYTYTQDLSYTYREGRRNYEYIYRYGPRPYKRRIQFGENYVYGVKLFLNYPVASSSMMDWDAFDENGVRIATGRANVSSGSGRKEVEIIFPVPYRPFFAVEFSYPQIANACDESASFCYELHLNAPSKYCSGGSCYPYSTTLSSSYQSFDYFYASVDLGNIALYPTCGALVKSKFMETDVNVIKTAINNLVAGGAARVNIGLNWGWRALSPRWRGLFNPARTTLPADYNTGNTKVAVLITQGENYKNQARTQFNSDGTYFDDNSLTTLCQNIKNNGIKLYVIGVGVTNSATQTRLRNCATNADSYVNANSASDANILVGRIADGLGTGSTGSLRISQ